MAEMESSKKDSLRPGRLTDSAVKIVVHPWRFGQPQLSSLHEQAKVQLFQSLVKRCSKLLYLLWESPTSSKNLPQKLDFAAKMLWRLHIDCKEVTYIAEPQVSLFVRYLLKLAFKLMGLVIRLYAELSEYYEQCSGEADASQEVPPDSTGGRQAGDGPRSVEEGPQAEVKQVQHSLKQIRRATSIDDPFHEGVSCDICGSQPIVGVRFKCLVCKDYDLCSSCVKKRMHNSEHEMMASTNPNVFDPWRILTGEPNEPMEWSSCETLLNLLWNCLLESCNLREQLRSQELLVEIVAGLMRLPIEFWKNSAYHKAHTDIISSCIKVLYVCAESSTTSELLGNADFLEVLQNIGKSPVSVLRISNKALLSRLISHGVKVPLTCVKLTSDEAKDIVSAVLETYKLSSRHLTLFVDTASLVKTFSVNPENLEEFVQQGLLLVLKSLLTCARSTVKPILTEIFQLLEQHKEQDVKPESKLFAELQHPLPGQQPTSLQDISPNCTIMGRDTQMEDEGMYELIDILLGHIIITVPEKPQTTNDVDSSTAHSIATALTLAYILFSQSDMEQRIQLAEYISQVPKLFDRISSLLKFIIFCEALPLEAEVILEMRLLLSLSEWTKYSPHVCMEVGKNGIIHLLNAIVSGTRQSFQLRESNAACLVMVLQTFLHCMQDQNYLWPFHRTKVLDNLLAFLKYPQIGFQVLSKLILSFLYGMMSDNELCMLELKPEDIEYIFPDFLLIERNPPSYVALILHSLINLTEIKDILDPVELNDPQKAKESMCSRKSTSKQRRKDTGSTLGQSVVTVIHTNVTKLSENFAVICCFESLLSSDKEVVQEATSRLLWNLLHSDAFSLQLLTSHDRILLMLQAMERWSPVTSALLWQLGKRKLEVGCSLRAYCFYVQCCYQFKKYIECIEWCNYVLSVTSQQQINNTAVLLKGKSLYYTYQRDQLLLAERIVVMTPKQAGMLRVRCYSKIEQVVMLLGKAHDFHYIDTEGSKLLDFAMLDYLREANRLGDCNRCLLCRNRAELRSSHVVPFSVLNELSADRITDHSKQVMVAADYSLKKPLTRRSPRQVAHKMLCGACENRLSLNAETNFCKEFFKPITHRRSDSIPYGEWLYHFCVSMVFRGLSHNCISKWPNSSELYNVFLLCRKHLLSLPYRKQREQKSAAESCDIRQAADCNECDELLEGVESEICIVEKEPHPQTALQLSGESSKHTTFLEAKRSKKHITTTTELAVKKQTSTQVQPSKKSIGRAQATTMQHTNELYNYNTTGDLEIHLLLLPQDVSSCPKDTLESLKDALGAPMITDIEGVQLNDGSIDYYGQAHFFLISFGSICILTKFKPSHRYSFPTETHILPTAGTYDVPKEEDLWKLLPYGVWHTLIIAAAHAERSNQLVQMQASKGSSKGPSYIGESEPLVDRGWAIESLKRQGLLKIETRSKDSPVTHSIETVSSCDDEGSPVPMQAQVASLLQQRRLVMNHTFLPDEFSISQYIPQRGAGHKCLVFPRGHYLLLHVTEKSEQKVVSLFLCFSTNAGYGSENPYILIIIHHFQHYHLADGVFVSLSKGIKVEKFLAEKGGSSKYRLTLSTIQNLVGGMFPTLMRAKGYYSVYSLMERASTIRSPQQSQQIPIVLDMKCSNGHCWYCEDLCHCCMKPASFGYTLLSNECHELLKFCSRSCQVIQEDYNSPPIVTEPLKNVQTLSPLPIQATKVIQTGACGNTVVTVQLDLERQTRRLYVLCLFRAPWQQIALDFFISDQYEPQMPVGYVLRYFTIRNIIRKLKALLCLLLKFLLHPEVQRKGYSSLSDLRSSLPCISTDRSPTHFHIPQMFSMLPPQFTFTKVEGSTPGHKCVSLPEGHHVLLHYTRNFPQNVWKTYFLCYSEEDFSVGTPYVVFLDGQTVKGTFISVRDEHKTANLMDLTSWSPDELNAIKNEVDEVLPTILENCGFTSVYALFQRQKCTSRLPSSVIELPLDHRCSTEGCWYCRELCHCCMSPVPTQRADSSKGEFCSSKCYDLFNKNPTRLPIAILREQLTKCDKISYLSESLVHVTAVVSTPLSKHTIAVINLCMGDGSDGVLALHPYILCQLRTTDRQVVLDYFVSKNFALTEPLWYAKSAIISSEVRQIIESSLIQGILQPAITQCLHATNLITVRNASDESAVETQGSSMSVTPFPSSLSITASTTDPHSKGHNQLSLPEGHEVLLHMTADQSDMTYFLCSCGQNAEQLYLLLASSWVTKLQLILGIIITSEEGMKVNGVMVAAVPALPRSMFQLVGLRMQQIVNSIHPTLLSRKGFLSIHSFLHRLKYSRSFPTAMLPPLDHKCSAKGCWFCHNLCHFCLHPVAMECHPGREEQAHLSNTLLFCSKVCRSMFLDTPFKFRSLLCFDLRNQPNQIGYLVPSPILHVLKVKLSLAYGNTVVSIILSIGDGSEGFPLGKPYVLYSVRSVKKATFCEMFLSSECTPQECLPYLASASCSEAKSLTQYISQAVELMGFPDLNSLVCHHMLYSAMYKVIEALKLFGTPT